MNAHSARADSGNCTPPTAPCALSSFSTVLLSPTDSPSTSPCNTLTCTPSMTSLAPLGAPCMSSSFPSSLRVTYNSIGDHTVTRATQHMHRRHQPAMMLTQTLTPNFDPCKAMPQKFSFKLNPWTSYVSWNSCYSPATSQRDYNSQCITEGIFRIFNQNI